MKGNVSGYVCNHGSPSGERDTVSPRGRYGECPQRDSVWRYICKNTTCWPATAHDVTTGVPQYKCRRENTSSFFVWSLRPKHGPKPRGRSVSFPTRGTMVTYVTWDVFTQAQMFLIKNNKICKNVSCFPQWNKTAQMFPTLIIRNQHIRVISEGSCDTDRRTDAANLAINYILKYVTIELAILHCNIIFTICENVCIFDQIKSRLGEQKRL